MGMYCAVGGVDVELGPEQLKELLAESLGKLGRRERVLGGAAGYYAAAFAGGRVDLRGLGAFWAIG